MDTVPADSDNMSPGEVQSSLQNKPEEERNNGVSPLARQSSIFSLTLDELQNAICENGKGFGSMNMDEFINSIWTAEEAQTQAVSSNNTHVVAAAMDNNFNNNHPNATLPYPISEAQNTVVPADHQPYQTIPEEPSLQGQGSMTLPRPLRGKTVDEVWEEIHKNQHDENTGSNIQNHGSAQRQVSLGEMTLEEFLVKVGVVRGNPGYKEQPPSQPHAAAATATYMPRPVMPLTGPSVRCPVHGAIGVATPTSAYQPFPHGSAAADASDGFPGNLRSAMYAGQPPVVYGGRVGNIGGSSAYGKVHGGIASASPASSDGRAKLMDGNRYGMDMGCGMRGPRKRPTCAPIEKVVERRQRRLIKNRESAARSRARKQAQTVETEAELNQLKEENAQLKQVLEAMEIKSKQQYVICSACFKQEAMQIKSKQQYVICSACFKPFEGVLMKAYLGQEDPQRANGNKKVKRTLSSD